MNGVPELVAGLPYTLGAWAFEKVENKASVLASPGFSGTWPVVDFCRGYSFLFLAKEELREEKRQTYEDLKKLMDAQFPAACN